MDRNICVFLMMVVCFLACQGQRQSGRNQRSGPECILPVNTGTCNLNISRYYFDLSTKSCKPFTFKGCGGNLNNFVTERDCNKRCICSKPVRPGNGGEDLVRYFFNADTDRCEQYSFTGRGGNANRFRSADECSATCVEEVVTTKRCDRRPDFGSNCGNSSIRYYYDKNCDCCREFTYLGCDGNGNRFETEAVCVNKCAGKGNRPVTSSPEVPIIINPASRPSMCYEPETKGPCSQNVQRYHFDVTSGMCKPFFYSGCGGNGNNFMILSDCNNVCKSTSQLTTTTQKPTPPQCLLQLKRGNCDRIVLRFYYNQSSRTCRMFLYSGCEGNANNFRSYMDCIGTCHAKIF